MAVSITIRNVPNDVRDVLALRAAASGRSLQEYLTAELRELASRPSVREAVAAARESARHFPPVTREELLADLDADKR